MGMGWGSPGAFCTEGSLTEQPKLKWVGMGMGHPRIFCTEYTLGGLEAKLVQAGLFWGSPYIEYPKRKAEAELGA